MDGDVDSVNSCAVVQIVHLINDIINTFNVYTFDNRCLCCVISKKDARFGFHNSI